jgi:histidyl-tRNA synthetase
MGLNTASVLRHQNISVVLAPPSRSLRGQMRFATATQSRFVVIIGDDEIVRGTLTLKDLDSGEQFQISENELPGLVVRQTQN